eukprot:3514005-Rhodomonas_salina.1
MCCEYCYDFYDQVCRFRRCRVFLVATLLCAALAASAAPLLCSRGGVLSRVASCALTSPSPHRHHPLSTA